VAAAVGVTLAVRAGHHPLSADRRPDRRPYSVGEVTCTFVDHSRSTPDYATGTSTPGRVLRTEIRYPTYAPSAASPPPAGEHFPVIVFAHGYDVNPDTYVKLLDAWVRGGFVVVAPIFPDTNPAAVHAIGGSDAGESDIVNQPGDLAYVTRRVIDDSDAPGSSCRRLYRLIRPSEIGLAGQSDGGETVAMLGYDSRYDSHPGIDYRAVAVLSGEEYNFADAAADPYLGHPSAPPLLVVQSDTDACNLPQWSVKLYDDDADSAKWFLRIFSARHLAPYDGVNAAAFQIVDRTTTRFFQIEVVGSPPGGRLTGIGNSEPATAHLSTGPTAPAIPSLDFSVTACYAG
jgi:hypothetical protein